MYRPSGAQDLKNAYPAPCAGLMSLVPRNAGHKLAKANNISHTSWKTSRHIHVAASLVHRFAAGFEMSPASHAGVRDPQIPSPGGAAPIFTRGNS
jgi:hypothetical protein